MLITAGSYSPAVCTSVYGKGGRLGCRLGLLERQVCLGTCSSVRYSYRHNGVKEHGTVDII